MTSIEQSLAIIGRGTDEILLKEELVEKLKLNRPLRIKAGFDPTAPDLHVGHTVLINKLKQLQEMGHEIYFLIGDFTGRIGDPTGKNVTRLPLSTEQVLENAQTYKAQIFKILDAEKTHVLFNSEWLNALSAKALINLAGKQTVARMLEREDFAQRYRNHLPISIHEFLYPLIQGYDSVVLQADIEIGGTDQKFNLLMGRELQKSEGQTPQVIITMPLLEGLDGAQKMSKSLQNYIGIAEPAEEIFGKVMSISDALMWRYYELISFQSFEQIQVLKERARLGENPRNLKILLAKELVARFYSSGIADKVEKAFIAQFSQGKMPETIPSFTLRRAEGRIPLVNALKEVGLIKSTSEGIRLIKQGGVKLDGETVVRTDQHLEIGKEIVVQVGKRRFAKIHFTSTQ